MSSGQEGKDPRCVGCKDYHKSDYDYPCKVCAHIDANMAKDWYEVGTINPMYTNSCSTKPMKIDWDKLDKEMEDKYLDKLINDHWAYIEKVLEHAGGVNMSGKHVKEIGFHYKSAFRHGWKHALEYVEENKDD